MIELTDQIAKASGWTPGDALLWLLTDQLVPMVSTGVRVETDGDYPRDWRVILTVPARLSPRQTLDEYLRLRETVDALLLEALRERSPPISSEDASAVFRTASMSDYGFRLAEFIATKNDGRSYREALEEWNSEVRPSWRRGTVADFCRATRDAYFRVTGKRLDWRRKRGQRLKEETSHG